MGSSYTEFTRAFEDAVVHDAARSNRTSPTPSVTATAGPAEPSSMACGDAERYSAEIAAPETTWRTAIGRVRANPSVELARWGLVPLSTLDGGAPAGGWSTGSS